LHLLVRVRRGPKRAVWTQACVPASAGDLKELNRAKALARCKRQGGANRIAPPSA